MKLKDKPALILVDIQKGMDDRNYFKGERNNPMAEENAKKALDYFRAHDLPIFHVQHCSTDPQSSLVMGKPGNEIKDIVKPLAGEPVITKNVNSAFIGTDLKEKLDILGIKKLVIVGLTTDHCISTTVRMAGNLGFDTYLLSDATAAFDKFDPDGQYFPAEIIHQTSLASLNGEFARVLKTEPFLREMSLPE
jgi:nicotinamidase-related amidase